MKRRLLPAFVLTVVAVFALSMLGSCTSCGRGKKEVPVFSGLDTATVVRLTEEYLDHVKAKEYDEALSMLHFIMSDSVRELPPERAEAIREQYKVFPVLDYELTGMKFITPHRVRMSYSITFFEAEEGSDIPNTITLNFEPQRIKGEWYLELSERSSRDADKRLKE